MVREGKRCTYSFEGSKSDRPGCPRKFRGYCKTLGEGVCELRIDWGPGDRVYFTMLGKAKMLILGTGEKSKQSADIQRAVVRLKDFKKRERAQ